MRRFRNRRFLIRTKLSVSSVSSCSNLRYLLLDWRRENLNRPTTKMNPICVTCGTQFGQTDGVASSCPICEDERQFVNWQGQQWTTLPQLQANHSNRIEPEAANLIGVGTEPPFAIGQRALLVQSPSGNLLWDCVSLVDHETIDRIQDLGGIRAIAISHPHFYSGMVEWSRAFNDAPVYLQHADRAWVMREDPHIEFWAGTTKALWDGMTLINCGGHFEGSSVLHWAGAAGGRGALLTGDSVQVVMDRCSVSFMRSYPNLIPLAAPAVCQIRARIEPFAFDQIYGGWWGRNILSNGKEVLNRSVDRYLDAIRAVAEAQNRT